MVVGTKLFLTTEDFLPISSQQCLDFLSVLCLIVRVLCRIQLVVSAQAYVLKFCYCFSNHLQMPGCEKALCFTALRCPGVSTYNNLD